MEARKEKLSLNPIQYLGQFLRWLLLISIIVACAFSFNQLKLSHYFYIKTVKVYGVNRVNEQDVQNILLPLVNHGFFTINIEDIKDRLLQMPWIADIFVRRDWPNQVEITIIEKTPIANWNGKRLLSDSGEIFSPDPKTYPENLPQFMGPESQQIYMLASYLQMNRLIQPLHAKISKLELTEFLTWKVMLDNGIELQLGHKDVMQRIANFVQIYPKIIGNHASDVDYVDLRYANGVAVRWKKVENNYGKEAVRK
jgi:cell division protein FtsQ